MRDEMPILALRNISKRFGGLVAVNRISLEIRPGEIVGIVGPNGSGKTTLFNIISGVFLPDEGEIIFAGRNITRMPAFKRAPLGIARTFQIPRPFSSATVRENIAVGAMFGSHGRKTSVREALMVADHYIELVGLMGHADKAAAELTPVEKKLMEIGRALAMRPKLLLMDEAMAGMHPKDIDDMVLFIRELAADEKVSVVAMVEHIMRAVTGLADRVVVLHHGSKLVDAPTKEALGDPSVVEIYLGQTSERPGC